MVGGFENRLYEIQQRKRMVSAHIEACRRKASEKMAEQRAAGSAKGKLPKVMLGVSVALFVFGAVMLALVPVIGIILIIAGVVGVVLCKVLGDRYSKKKEFYIKQEMDNINQTLNGLFYEMQQLNAEEGRLIQERDRLIREEESRRKAEEERLRQEEEMRRKCEEEKRRKEEEEEKRRRAQEEKRRIEERKREQREKKNKLYQELLACDQTPLVKKLEKENKVEFPIKYLYKLKMLSKVLKERGLEPMTIEEIHQSKMEWEKGYFANEPDRYIRW